MNHCQFIYKCPVCFEIRIGQQDFLNIWSLDPFFKGKQQDVTFFIRSNVAWILQAILMNNAVYHWKIFTYNLRFVRKTSLIPNSMNTIMISYCPKLSISSKGWCCKLLLHHEVALLRMSCSIRLYSKASLHIFFDCL